MVTTAFLLYLFIDLLYTSADNLGLCKSSFFYAKLEFFDVLCWKSYTSAEDFRVFCRSTFGWHCFSLPFCIHLYISIVWIHLSIDFKKIYFLIFYVAFYFLRKRRSQRNFPLWAYGAVILFVFPLWTSQRHCSNFSLKKQNISLYFIRLKRYAFMP